MYRKVEGQGKLENLVVCPSCRGPKSLQTCSTIWLTVDEEKNHRTAKKSAVAAVLISKCYLVHILRRRRRRRRRRRPADQLKPAPTSNMEK